MSGKEEPASPAVKNSSGPDTVACGRRTAASSFVSTLAVNEDERVHWPDASSSLPGSDPALRLAVVTCMDTRLDPATLLGITVGDAHILRNAGGRVTPDVIRSLHLSVSLMNVREIGILHHTNCGLEGIDNDTLIQRTGVDSIDFLPFQSFHDSLSADVTAVLQARILPVGGIVWGGVFRLDSQQISVIRSPITVTYSPV